MFTACADDKIEVGFISNYPQNNYNMVNKMQSMKDVDEVFLAQEFGDYDFRTMDLSEIDLLNYLSVEDFNLLSRFDSRTIWPKTLPQKFRPDELLLSAKTPGLGVKSLHKEGINGEGIGIAIIDQQLLVNHVEYKDQVSLYYSMVDYGKYKEADYHGAPVASIAVGKNVGVAPKANLYYVASYAYDGEELDFSNTAKAIDFIVEFNSKLSVKNKIRVISISSGFGNDWSIEGARKFDDAVKRANDNGLEVLCTNQWNGIHEYSGASKIPYANADDIKSYKANEYIDYNDMEGRNSNPLLVPMDGVTVASAIGENDYEYMSKGGYSWVIPYMAGVYVLACQVDPTISFDELTDILRETGTVVEKEVDGEVHEVGILINPVKAIKAIKDN